METRTKRQRISRLLIIEDDESQLLSLTAIMEGEGFEVVGCWNASDALERLRLLDVGVAIVDLRLPDMSVTELLQRLSAYCDRVRLIINTGYSSYETAREALNLGAFAYVEKAGDPDELVRHVHRAFKAGFHSYAEELEEAVSERTRKLREANELLKEEMVNRKRAEKERFEYQERLKAMASQLSRVQELERRKLSKRLHDSISQGLAMTRLSLQQSAQSATDAALAERLNGVATELRRIMEESYSLILELSNPILYELGLVSALKSLVESRFLEDQGIKCKLRSCEDRLGLDRDIKVTLYQAVREILINIAKHAKAEAVEVLIEKDGDCLRISVKDDGVGFDASEVGLPSTTGGFGLFSLRESLGGIGGELEIKSKPGQGTIITISAPLVCKSTP